MSYLATFTSHFGAIRFKRLCQERGIDVELMPVPRSLSSACGTCARFLELPYTPQQSDLYEWPGEVEVVVQEAADGGAPYTELYRAFGL